MSSTIVDSTTGNDNVNIQESLLEGTVLTSAAYNSAVPMLLSAASKAGRVADPEVVKTYFTKNSFLKNLFKVQSGTFSSSVEELMEKYPYLPLFAIFSLLIAKTTEGSVETIMEVIRSQQKQQKVTTQSIIDDTNYMQQKKEELSESDWKALVGTDVTGAERKEKPKNEWWKIIIGVAVVVVALACSIVAGVVASPAAGIGLGVAVIGGLMAIGSIYSLIANVVDDPVMKRELTESASIVNPIQAISEGLLDTVCEIWGLDPNDEKIRKAKMWLTLALTIISAIIGIAASIITGGASAGASVANIVNVVSGIVTGVTSIVTGALEIRNGERALDRAKMRKIINQVQASIERLKNILDSISINIELWTEMFSNEMTVVRGEYDRVTRMLKEYNDQKLAIAGNIRV